MKTIITSSKYPSADSLLIALPFLKEFGAHKLIDHRVRHSNSDIHEIVAINIIDFRFVYSLCKMLGNKSCIKIDYDDSFRAFVLDIFFYDD